jgi:pyruvate formate lyase activating enzyme
MTKKSGLILHLQRLSTEDGPGIRTTVFFKGCPLRCLWCHNPESLSRGPQVQWLENRCIGCGTCVDACPNACLTLTEVGIVIARERCAACGACAQACPANAMELLGTTVGVEALVAEVCKDRTYFETSGGGVTASGGEPLMQPEFVAAFMRRLKEAGISTALDTCGLASHKSLEKVLPYVDVVLFDLKEIDPHKHQAFTGQGNEVILDNLLFVRDRVKHVAPGTRLWLRTPLIPDATATPENVTGLGAFIAQNLDGLVERWELCAFNNLCRDKYHRLSLAWPYDETPLLAAETLQALEERAKGSGVAPDIVVATGATRSVKSV